MKVGSIALFENIKNWEKQRENLDNIFTLWEESWTISLQRMLVFLLIVVLLVRIIRETSRWDFLLNNLQLLRSNRSTAESISCWLHV